MTERRARFAIEVPRCLGSARKVQRSRSTVSEGERSAGPGVYCHKSSTSVVKRSRAPPGEGVRRRTPTHLRHSWQGMDAASPSIGRGKMQKLTHEEQIESSRRVQGRCKFAPAPSLPEAALALYKAPHPRPGFDMRAAEPDDPSWRRDNIKLPATHVVAACPRTGQPLVAASVDVVTAFVDDVQHTVGASPLVTHIFVVRLSSKGQEQRVIEALPLSARKEPFLFCVSDTQLFTKLQLATRNIKISTSSNSTGPASASSSSSSSSSGSAATQNAKTARPKKGNPAHKRKA